MRSLILFSFPGGAMTDHWLSLFFPLCAMTYGEDEIRVEISQVVDIHVWRRYFFRVRFDIAGLMSHSNGWNVRETVVVADDYLIQVGGIQNAQQADSSFVDKETQLLLKFLKNFVDEHFEQFVLHNNHYPCVDNIGHIFCRQMFNWVFSVTITFSWTQFFALIWMS